MTRQTLIPAIFWLCAVLATGYGVSKLFFQKTHRPEFANKADHLFDGFVAIDNHAYRAELFRRVLTGDNGALGELTDNLRTKLHPTSTLVPAAVGLLALALPSIPLAFALLSWSATIGAALLAGKLALALSPRAGKSASAIASLLAIGHVFTLRTIAQLHLDPFCNLWALGILLTTIRWLTRKDPISLVFLHLLLASSTLIKLSLLPFAAVPFFGILTFDSFRNVNKYGLHLCTLALALLAPWIGSLLLLDGLDRIFVDFVHLKGTFQLNSRHILHFGIEMALLFQASLFFCFTGDRDRRVQNLLLISLLVTLASTWGFSLPPIPRLYLPVMSILSVLMTPGILARFPANKALLPLAVHFTLNFSLAVAGLWGSYIHLTT